MRLKSAQWLVVCVLLASCDKVPDRAPTLAELKVGDKVKASGKWLMSVPNGLTRLDAPPNLSRHAVVAVHGYGSRGYEWVDALKVMGASGAQVYFFRWDWRRCPRPAAQALSEAIEALVKGDAEIDRLTVLGHSYGGLVAAIMAQDHAPPLMMDLHVVAAPLAGHEKLTGRCDFEGLSSAAPRANVAIHQWRTVKAQDGAFKSLERDPQVVVLSGSEVTRLPAMWNGRRLGHNWSVSWVARQIQSGAADRAGGSE